MARNKLEKRAGPEGFPDLSSLYYKSLWTLDLLVKSQPL